MEFGSPIYALLIIPATTLLFFSLQTERCRKAALQRFAEPHLLRRLVPPERPFRRALRHLLPYLATLLLIIALMRPQWGIVMEESSDAGLDILFTIDLSRSMLADDLAPTRLAVAKEAVAKISAASHGDRIGLIGFAGTAFLLCPLTTDRAIFNMILADLGTNTLPRGGSSLLAALDEAGRVFHGTGLGGRVLVVITDGEDHGGRIGPAAATLRTAGVTFVPVVAGTTIGGIIPLADGSFVKDRNGTVVKSHATFATMQQLDTQVVTLAADGAAIKDRLKEIRSTSTSTVKKLSGQKQAECYQLPLAIALFLWCSALLIRRGDVAT